MRKSERQTEQLPFVLVRDFLPETAEFLRRVLRKTDLAEQVKDLRIYGRCPCGAPSCGTFYCVSPEEHGDLVRRHGSDGSLDPLIISNGRIIEVHTLDPKVDAVLDRLFPDTPGVATRRFRSWLSDLLVHFHKNAPATESDLETVERLMKIQFPTAYREFLLLANGGKGVIGPNAYVMLWRVEDLIQFNREYQVQDYAPSLLLFGSDGGGEAFAFDSREPALPVVSVPFIGMSTTETILLSATFDSFLEYLGSL